MRIKKNLINSVLKISLDDEKYHKAIDSLCEDNLRRNDFKLNGKNKICFYTGEMYLLFSIDTLDNKLDINTNILQSRMLKLKLGRNDEYNFVDIDYETDMSLILRKILNMKLKKVKRVVSL